MSVVLLTSICNYMDWTLPYLIGAPLAMLPRGVFGPFLNVWRDWLMDMLNFEKATCFNYYPYVLPCLWLCIQYIICLNLYHVSIVLIIFHSLCIGDPFHMSNLSIVLKTLIVWAIREPLGPLRKNCPCLGHSVALTCAKQVVDILQVHAMPHPRLFLKD